MNFQGKKNTELENIVATAIEFHQKGQLELAEELYNKALQIKPDHNTALCNLGSLYAAKGIHQKAIFCFEKALETGQYAEVYYNMANSFYALGKYQEAVVSYEKAIQIRPKYKEVYSNLQICLFALASQNFEAGKFTDAEKNFNEILKISPDNLNALIGLGNSIIRIGKLKEAIDVYRKALLINPNNYDLHNNIGVAFHRMQENENAIEAFQKAISVFPDFYQAHCNIGVILYDIGNYDNAILYFKKAIELNKNFPDAHYSLSKTLLMKGDFKNGWKEYEWRWKSANTPESRYNKNLPVWNGASLENKTICVWGEGSIEDEIFFASMIPELAQKNAKIVIEAKPELISLFAKSFPYAACLSNNEYVNINTDYHVTMGSLPLLLNHDSEKSCMKNPYLVADNDLSKGFKEKYKSYNRKLVVGIAWKDSFPSQNNYPNLLEWSKILKTENILFVNLQYGDSLKDIELLKKDLNIEIFNDTTCDFSKNIDTFAAQIASVDLVLSVDNITGVLAGAIGLPTWTILPLNHNWRWSLDTGKSLFFPFVRLFRLSKSIDFKNVLQEVQKQLKNM